MLGLYAPELTRQRDRRVDVIEWPDDLSSHD